MQTVPQIFQNVLYVTHLSRRLRKFTTSILCKINVQRGQELVLLFVRFYLTSKLVQLFNTAVTSEIPQVQMSIHLIMGAMGAGKTATLLKDYNKVPENKRIMLKHQFDNRFSSDFNSLVCRDGTAVHATPVNRLDDASARIRARFGTLSLIAVDEGHFFDDITEFASMWARHGKNVIVTGIGRGLFMEPLPNMSNLLAKADSVTVLTGICKLCSGVAGFNYRVSAFCEDTEDPVLKFVGDKEYIALCRYCFYKRMREDLDEKKGMFVDEKLRTRAEHMFLAERQLVPNDQPLYVYDE